MRTLNMVCVFCGSSPGKNPAYMVAAEAVGAAMARRNIDLIYGAGNIGLMGAVSRSVDQHGGNVTGVIPGPLMSKEIMGGGVGEVVEVDSMHTRKAMMESRADAFIVLPGGYGTLEELFEMITWAQLGIHAKPIGLLNVDGFFDPLVQLIDHVAAEGFVRPTHRELIFVAEQPDELLDKLQTHELPPAVVDWHGRAEKLKM
ncbi:MAG: TIGR00730 family Rossman fold protein [Chloroflexota bacterium]